MFGNNNCQLKIKDLRMGPVDPGTQKSAGEPSNEETDGTGDDDESDGSKEESKDEPFLDDLYESAASDVVPNTEVSRPGSREEEMRLLKKKLKEKGHLIKNNIKKELLLKLLEHRLTVKLNGYLAWTDHDSRKKIRLRVFEELSREDRFDIKNKLSEYPGMLSLEGSLTRIPVEMWFKTEKCMK